MMFKQNYYYLIAGLPDILLDESRTKISVADLLEEIKVQLHPDDYRLLQVLFLKYDNANVLNLLQKRKWAFDNQGIYSQDFLEEQIREPDDRIHKYLRRFIEEFKSGERDNPAKPWENVLEEYYFDFLLTIDNDFVREWFRLQLNLNNVTTALSCRKHDIPAENQLIGNNEVVHSILRSNARDFGLSQDFPEIEQILAAWEQENMLEREKALDTIRWDWINENTFFHYFTVERVIGYILQLEMVERWMALDRQEGERMFRELLEKLGSSFEMPEDFQLQHTKRK
ncbi:MAG: DUF2764 family protein [Bacteroidales bacterium]